MARALWASALIAMMVAIIPHFFQASPREDIEQVLVPLVARALWHVR
jgi:hypothetical protein